MRRAEVATLLRWVLLPVVWLGLTSRAGAEDKKVLVYQEQNGRQIALFAKLEDCTEATITIRAALTNLTPSEPLPLTVDAAGRTKFKVVTLTVTNPTKEWRLDWHFDWKVGRRLEKKPPPYVYSLPYRSGPFRVIQGPYGSFSHFRGSGNEEAIDWAMPVGTEVYPARPGIVVAVRQDCSEGGPNLRYKPDFNYVIVLHDDGTFAQYAHLKQDGVLAHLGDRVTTGQPIALSGNTGYTRGPHLHFEVFNPVDGSTDKTLPVLFKSRTGETSKPQEGRSY